MTNIDKLRAYYGGMYEDVDEQLDEAKAPKGVLNALKKPFRDPDTNKEISWLDKNYPNADIEHSD